MGFHSCVLSVKRLSFSSLNGQREGKKPEPEEFYGIPCSSSYLMSVSHHHHHYPFSVGPS